MNNQIKALQLISQKKKTSHVLHFLMSIVTDGLWVLPWIIVALSNSIENGKIERKLECIR